VHMATLQNLFLLNPPDAGLTLPMLWFSAKRCKIEDRKHPASAL